MNVKDFNCPENTTTFIEQKPDGTVIVKCEELDSNEVTIIVFLLLFFGWLFMFFKE
jgi:hypothetical protein